VLTGIFIRIYNEKRVRYHIFIGVSRPFSQVVHMLNNIKLIYYMRIGGNKEFDPKKLKKKVIIFLL